LRSTQIEGRDVPIIEDGDAITVHFQAELVANTRPVIINFGQPPMVATLYAGPAMIPENVFAR